MTVAALEEKAKNLPELPGVYLFQDETGAILYVGKAVSLRNRVRSYFQETGLAARTRSMVSLARDLDFITTASAVEALILESNLIKKHRPRFNIRLRDDKHYPYLKVTISDEWPRVLISRSMRRDGARYFGPYTRSGAVRETLRLIRRLFPYRTCTDQTLRTIPRPCLNYHIKRCLGPCHGHVTPEEYRAMIEELCLFLEGRRSQVVKKIKEKMEEAAENLEFERAAEYRDKLKAIEEVTEKQKIISAAMGDQDVIGLARGGMAAMIHIFYVREGKVVGRDQFPLQGAVDLPEGEVLGAFLKQFYQEASFIPTEILLPAEVEEAEEIQTWLSGKVGRVVRLKVPRRGNRAELVEMAVKNAQLALEQERSPLEREQELAEQAMSALHEELGLPSLPHRIEGYDISNIQGQQAVGSMVVFVDGQSEKQAYRKFKIKNVQGADDFAMMAEVITRRFRRGLLERAEGQRGGDGIARSGSVEQGTEKGAGENPFAKAAHEVTERGEPSVSAKGAFEADTPTSDLQPLSLSEVPRPEEPSVPMKGAFEADTPTSNLQPPSFARFPDLIVIDGGKGQLNAAREALQSLGLSDLPVIGLAKREEEVFLPERSDPIILPRDSQALFLLQRLRDEAHRFAVGYHRQVRSKETIRSILDEIPGIGPKRKRTLLQHFGSVAGIKAAAAEEIATLPGMNRALAEKVKGYL
ncbi:MAG: excinuclease ABC subunit UvrC [Firmicutes bacterium]|nr:excinuclease ABC subunit UvrC [Bacillota bacterium]